MRTAVSRHADLDRDLVAGVLDELQAQAASALDREGFARDAHRYVRTADLRYVGQAFEVRVPTPDGPVDAAFADRGGRRLPRRAPSSSTATTSATTPASRSSG